MPFYKTTLDRILLSQGQEAHDRTCKRLQKLRGAFRGEETPDLVQFPPRRTGKLLLATWNLREFGKRERTDEAMLYIAEIISRFDLVAVQEVRRNLKDLYRLLDLLGDGWQHLVTDLVSYTVGGNQERLAYIFDTKRVKFRGIAGELSLKPEKLPEGGYRSFKFARDPYIVGFRSGWFKFSLVTVHILWGKSQAENPARVKEISAVAEAVRDRSTSGYAFSDHHVLLGDFNIFKTADKTFTALTDCGFRIPETLQNAPTNALKTKHYDQIAFMTASYDRLVPNGGVETCGAFDFYSVVYQENSRVFQRVRAAAGHPQYRSYKDWRTYQMSDHLPMWVQLKTDHTEEYLDYRLRSTEEVRLRTGDGALELEGEGET